MSCSINSTRDWLENRNVISNNGEVLQSLQSSINEILQRARTRFPETLPEAVSHNDVLYRKNTGKIGFYTPFFEWVDKENVKRDARIEEARDQNKEDAERTGEIYSDDYLYQLEGTESSKASPETIEKVKEAAKKMGISFTDLATYLKGNPDMTSTSVNALADLTQGVIAISQGKEDVALTEEMVHVATAILEQTNPALVKEMITKITKFKIYQTTLAAYRDNPAYQLENGKPDIRKIKKESVDKLITELIIEQNQGSTEYPELLEEVNRSMWRGFWQKVLNFFNINYKKANLDIFSGAAEQVLTGEIGRVEDYDLDGIYLQISDKQKDIQQRILDTKNYVEKREKDPNEDDSDPMLSVV